jgi:protein-tyrosine phosphatase
MIDIHSHILHGLDDGAASFDVSLAMAKLAHESGTTDIVATPHANTVYAYQPEVISERIGELQQAIGDGLKIHRGCDFHLSAQNIQWVLREPARFSVNGLNYLLVEFPELALFRGIDQIFSELRSAGLTPIVTHPERNRHLAGDVERLRRWVEGGIPLQITAKSLTGGFGPELARWCLDALNEGLVHFVASDAHDPVHRPPRLDEAKRLLDDRFGSDYAELLVELHPRAVIEGLRIECEPIPPTPKKSRKWFHFVFLRDS